MQLNTYRLDQPGGIAQSHRLPQFYRYYSCALMINCAYRTRQVGQVREHASSSPET
ncbi:hypothetical protein RSal33209_3315 [Renibacterium salmoninarum ATCC 33209]|uniref:Uncharacterized protein n=1 Tax=Renibacterium salmoninarum (strain ATCC 33209 / DSM 20767 / JCM 11484 / NBRC 15589 / NCIMB 2235) TaxID=288705 RepID=A9WV06_RENSM|nr:hypothetical protein RSal33209_3315 [Renibacterium salmoninarum ATCC 33209]